MEYPSLAKTEGKRKHSFWMIWLKRVYVPENNH
jgi:hypothetical protein